MQHHCNFAKAKIMATVMNQYTFGESTPVVEPPTAVTQRASTSMAHRVRTHFGADTDPLQNRLLALLPQADRTRLLPQLEPVELRLGKVLHDCGGTSGFVHFPTSAIVSHLTLLDDGASAETAVVGREGVVGFPSFMEGNATPGQSIVMRTGGAIRMRSHVLASEMNRSGALLNLLLRHTQALLAQMAQIAVCNRHHRLDAQLCRWLLLMLDRSRGSEILMTQELIASMLGVRREGVTAAAGKLQAAGLICYRRGLIRVLDRVGLEQRTCECYAIVRNEYECLLPALESDTYDTKNPGLRNTVHPFPPRYPHFAVCS
jgi:CRP-like cAMP-binding protein